MRTIIRILLHIAANTAALAAAGAFVPDVAVPTDLPTLVSLGAVLAALSLMLRPVLKLLFGPLILLTFGAFLLVVNSGILLILDFMTADFTLTGYQSLLATTLIVGAVNVGFAALGRLTGVTKR